MGLRDSIFSAVDVGEESITIPEWGNSTILLKGLVAGQWQRVQQGSKGEGMLSNVLTIIETSYDPETKKRLFEPADRDVLLTKNMFVIERIVRKVLSLSGMDDAKKAELEKNLGSLPTPDSSLN